MFKFTIRETILMTTIVAILEMWWIERNQNAKNDARLTAIETRLRIHQAKGNAATIHLSSDTPYSKLDALLKGWRVLASKRSPLPNPRRQPREMQVISNSLNRLPELKRYHLTKTERLLSNLRA